MARERGAATVEWTALVLLVAVVLGGATAAVGALSAVGLARAVRCAILAGCQGEDRALGAIYGDEVAGYVRAFAPGIAYERGTLTLPVDFRRCRSHRCSDAPDAHDHDVWTSRSGRVHAAVFTHVVDRRAAGGALYIQYWLYYPDSTWSGAAYAVGRSRLVGWTPLGRAARGLAGHHVDDWESYQLKITAGGRLFARASAHNGYAGPKRWPNLNALPVEPRVPDLRHRRLARRRRTSSWTQITGWTHVARGSHAGYIPSGPGDGERGTESDGLALIPLESLSDVDRAAGFVVAPPWRKPVYADPERTDT